MSMKNVSIKTNTNIETAMSKLTKSQKALVMELRENKDVYLRNELGYYKLYSDKGLVRVVNTKTIDKLLAQEILVYLDPHSNKISLSNEAK